MDEQDKQYMKAIKAYKDAVERDPSWWGNYNGLSECQYKEGLFNESLQSIDKALELNPALVRILREIVKYKL